MPKRVTASLALLVSSLVLFGGCRSDDSDRAAASNTTRNASTDTLQISNAWMRPAPEGGVTALYLDLHNQHSRADTLAAVSTPVSSRTEIHETVHNEDGTTGMRPLEGGLPVQPDTVSTLHPGGPHVMVYDVQPALTIGDSVRVTLQFGTSERTLTVPVRPTPPQ